LFLTGNYGLGLIPVDTGMIASRREFGSALCQMASHLKSLSARC